MRSPAREPMPGFMVECAAMKNPRLFSIPLLAAALLLLAGCDENTELMKSVMHDRIAEVRGALDAGAEVNERNNYGWTALMHAARLGNDEIVALLVDKGADINAADNDGWTALMRASHRGHTETVKLLLLHRTALGRAARPSGHRARAACRRRRPWFA
jgi:ankyrin repeat protein